MPTKEIKQIKEIKLRYLPQKENEYGTNHFFEVLDITPVKQLIELKEMKMHIWEYNGKYDLETNAVKFEEAQVENCVKKDVPYIKGLTFSKYDFQKNGEQITGYSISEINKKLLI